jgi:hypothetical protein
LNFALGFFACLSIARIYYFVELVSKELAGDIEVTWVPIKSNRFETKHALFGHGAGETTDELFVLLSLVLAPSRERWVVISRDIGMTMNQGKALQSLKVIVPCGFVAVPNKLKLIE